jgi:arylsulfate sulfotransferase
MRDCRVFLLLVLTCMLVGFVGCGSSATSESHGSQALPSPGQVSATNHPLVARYSVTAPAAGTVSVEFGTTTSYGRSTVGKSVALGGGPVDVFVAGMHPRTTYHMRARVDFSDGTFMMDSDRTFTTGTLPKITFPTASATPAGLAKSGGIELVSGLGPNVSAVALDTDGSVIWYYYDPTLPSGTLADPIRALDNGDFLINFGNDVREVDLGANIVRQVTLAQLNTALAAAGYSLQAATIHHDVLRLSNGHWILLVNENRDFQDLPGYPGTITVLGDALVDLDANNQPVWIWRAFDHLDVNRHPFAFPDWTHSNGIVYAPDGSLLLSIRHQSWIIKIDYANGAGSGDVLWRLGPGGDFTLSTTDPAQWFYNQHYPLLLKEQGPSMQIGMFDNGDTRPDSSGQSCVEYVTCYSRAVIMDIDESALTAQTSWQYSPGWYSLWGGSIAVLPNGDVELDSTMFNQAHSRVIEVTPGTAPQVVWQMDTPDTFFYRAYRIPSLYPGVTW